MHTPWGYEVDSLPPLVDVTSFDAATGSRFAGDLRAQQAIAAASAAIRNECGWHVSPVLACRAVLTPDGRLARMPAKMVESVESVFDHGQELAEGQYEWRRDGLLRRACFCNWKCGWGGIEVAYTAGFEPCAVQDLASACIHIAEAVLAVPAGIASEAAGGVSVSYSAAASSVAASMAAGMRGTLAPYRLVSSHAA